MTNQSGIARGIYSEGTFLNLHKKIKEFLISENIFIDEVKYCPHHPKFGNKKYKVNCKCRKPNNKMLKDLIDYWNIKSNKSIMLGDKKSDFISAKKTNIKFYYSNLKNINKINKFYRNLI